MSDANKRRIYTKEFKQDALNLSKEPGYTLVSAARRLGIHERQLYRWRKEFERGGSLAFPGNGREALTDTEKENRLLRKQLRDAELENAILKKAVGIFSRVPK